MNISLLLDSCSEPVAVVTGEVVHEQNTAWRSAVGPEASLAACFAPEDHAAVRQALAQAVSERASFVARLATGARAGAPMRCTAWSAGEDALCLRIDGPVPTESDIAWSKEKSLLWIFERIDAVVWTILADGTIALSDGPALAHYGISSGQLVGANSFQLYPHDSQSARTTRRVLAGEAVHDGYAEDDVYWLQHCHPLRGAGGEVLAEIGLAIGVTNNVREKRNAENLLQIINALPMVVWAMTSDGTCTLSAGKGLAQFGFAPGELVGRSMFELYASAPEITADYRRVLAGESFTSTSTINGVTWSTAYHCAWNGTGDVTGLYAICEDISERARREQQMLEQLTLIQAQKQAIDLLVSPIIEVWRGVLVVPLFGDIGEDRASIVTERLLEGVIRHRARFAILDLTGLDVVDTTTAQRLFNIMRGVDLLGCTPLISGIQPSLALTMVSLGVEIPPGRTYSTLADALQRCVSRAPVSRA